MSRFQILCATMHQKDFSKIKEMNIHSDAIFANQSGINDYQELDFEGHRAKLISTDTIGVGKNRNLALLYADSEICLLADDDMTYRDDVEQVVLSEFDRFPEADIIIFNIDTDDAARKQKRYSVSRKCHPLERMPWGAVRIAFRLSSVRKANLWFSTMFGGGAPYPSGEDSMWLNDAKRKGLKMYISGKTIGTVSFADSSWFSGRNEEYFFGRGAYYQAVHPKTIYLWMLYFAFRVRTNCELTFSQKTKWMLYGSKGYKKSMSYQQYIDYLSERL